MKKTIILLILSFVLNNAGIVYAQNDLTLNLSPSLSLNDVLSGTDAKPAKKAKTSAVPQPKAQSAVQKKAEMNSLISVNTYNADSKIKFSFSKNANYNKFYLKSPARLVIDIDNCVYKKRKLFKTGVFFKKLRIAQYNKKVVRIVLEDPAATDYSVSRRGTSLFLQKIRKKLSNGSSAVKSKSAEFNKVQKIITIPLSDKVTFKIISSKKSIYRFGTFGFNDRYILDIYNARNKLNKQYMINEQPISRIQTSQILPDKTRIIFRTSALTDYNIDQINDTIYITFSRPSEKTNPKSHEVNKKLSISMLTNKLQLLIEEKDKKIEVQKTIRDEDKKYYDSLISSEKENESKAKDAYAAGAYDTANLFLQRAMRIQLETDHAYKKYQDAAKELEKIRKHYESLINNVLDDLKKVKIENVIVSPTATAGPANANAGYDKKQRSESIAENKTIAKQKYAAAVDEIEKGNFKKALELLDEAAKYDPTNKKIMDIRYRLREQLEL